MTERERTTPMRTIQPFGDRILVKMIETPQQTASGIYLPDTSKEKPSEGEIIAIGEGSHLQEKLSVGDKIYFQKYSGSELKADGVSYLILEESHILARIIEIEKIPELTQSRKK